ncbi:putative mitochondrial protein [Apostasia shenzhenica]|uniref:Putative mitochondrial protein n=1 Tax=Apostasia shenzhenica TaxID=1088818 RepID=A0A2I0B4Z9_9ASPA|nr:putative mitochondrial protein [Apostasia shenzhenica]
MHDSDLQDAGFIGPAFTWCNNQAGGRRIWERLDRVLFNSTALVQIPGLQVAHLARIGSDHCPLLSGSDIFKSQGGIKFEDVWLSYEEAAEIVQTMWRYPVRGNPPSVLSKKSARTLKALKKWSKKEVGDLLAKTKDLDQTILSLQSKEAASLLQLVANYNTTMARAETWWWQRAKTQWLTKGDRNTSFFHRVAIGKKRQNWIHAIVDASGHRTTKEIDIFGTMMEFFTSKWGIEDTINDFPSDLQPRATLSPLASAQLIREVTREEIRAAVFSLANNKAPGVDGVTGSFLKGYWAIVEREVVDAVLHTFSTGFMPQTWKDTLVALVPKTSNAEQPKQFRPISLCTTVYKVIAKVLVHRLKEHILSLVSLEQGAFVPGRFIADNCILAQEIMHRLMTTKSRDGYMIVKVDLEQAYDRISWDYLDAVLNWFGFPNQWRRWVNMCIRGPRYALLINGKKSPWIRASRGLRQGCPLSPYLFILSSELLSTMVHREMHKGMLSGIKITPLFPLLFATSSRRMLVDFYIICNIDLV